MRRGRNNLILGICDQLLAARDLAREVYFATVEDADQIVACALRTPPSKAVITRGDDSALQCLVDDLAAQYGTLPAVLGPEPEVGRFADMWAERLGTAVRPGMRQRVFEIREVTALQRPVPGTWRLASEGDLAILVPWIAAFQAEVHVTEAADPNTVARDRIAQKRLYVWEDGQVVSMAAQGSQTPTGASINLVYTPPMFRQSGFSQALISCATGLLLVAVEVRLKADTTYAWEIPFVPSRAACNPTPGMA